MRRTVLSMWRSAREYVLHEIRLRVVPGSQGHYIFQCVNHAAADFGSSIVPMLIAQLVDP